jgi:Tol biopolymer transport system component
MAKKKYTYWRMLAAVGLVVALAYGCAGREAAVDNSGELSSKEGQIAFTRISKWEGTDIEAYIYTINVDGTGERKLTDTTGLDTPTWSPDGQRLAFVSDRDDGNSELYVMDSDGTHQRRLTNTPEEESWPAWSPNGEQIAYAIDPNGDSTIWVMNTDGSHRTQLASGFFPTWSPDGERIAYTTYYGERPTLAVMNSDGSEQRSLGASLVQKAFGIGSAEEPAWSPDGERITFAAPVGRDNEEIFVMNANGSGRTRLTDIPGHDHWPPTWSPDGTRIAFTSDGTKATNPEIYVMNSDGSGLTKLTDDPAEDAYPVWRP